MTVNTTNAVDDSIACNGSLTVFNFTFQISAEADLVVILTDADGVETTLANPTHYSVSAGPWETGGSITTVATYASGYSITMSRETEAKQNLDLLEGGLQPADAVELALDKAIRLAQEARAQIDRCLQITGVQRETISTLLSGLTPGRFLRFKDDGSGFDTATLGDPGSVVFGSAGEAFVGGSDLASLSLLFYRKSIATPGSAFTLSNSHAGAVIVADQNSTITIDDPSGLGDGFRCLIVVPLNTAYLVDLTPSGAYLDGSSSTINMVPGDWVLLAKNAAGTSLIRAAWNTPTTDYPSVAVTHSANQSVTFGVGQVSMTWDTEEYDDASMHSTSTNPERITCPRAGAVEVSCCLDWSGSVASAGLLSVQIYKGATKVAENYVYQGVAVAGTQSVSTGRIEVAAGDYFRVYAQDDTGTTLNVSGGASSMTRFAMRYVP